VGVVAGVIDAVARKYGGKKARRVWGGRAAFTLAADAAAGTETCADAAGNNASLACAAAAPPIRAKRAWGGCSHQSRGSCDHSAEVMRGIVLLLLLGIVLLLLGVMRRLGVLEKGRGETMAFEGVFHGWGI